MTIETERLTLIALKPDMLRLLADDIPALERELSCVYDAEKIDGHMLDITRKQYEVALADPENYVWHSFFLFLRREDRTVVGSADFKAPPDENGDVEIGYGLGESQRGRGYMTEAVSAMCRWAKENGAKRVIAETLTDNEKSQNVLKRCGFRLYKSGDTFWWEL